MAVIGLRIVRINPEGAIKKLKKHALLLLAIWVCLVPAFAYVYAALGGNVPALARVTEGAGFQCFFGALVFLMLFFVYLTFYYVVDRSITTRMMIEIERSPGKGLDFGELTRNYDIDTKYKNELQGMLDGGFIRKEGEYYVNTGKGAAVAAATAWYKKTFRLGKGG